MQYRYDVAAGECRNAAGQKGSNGPLLAPCGDLTGANLKEFDLRGKDLTGARLCGANVAGVRLDDAMLRGADLRGATLAEARCCSIPFLTRPICPVSRSRSLTWSTRSLCKQT
ncbi:MAG: pentapeptide repeat-containing protein [Acidobacteria bacterium]|nr:pentapeptide repeat-containing protein [Acidobacteriota bacterium]